MKKTVENEEISIDLETGEEILTEEDEVNNTTLKAKLKDIRKELLQAQKERDENLAGWQRAKADLVNFRKSVEKDSERNKIRAKVSIVQKIVPVLDSFSSAMKEKTWQDINTGWREGVERIASQLTQILKAEGLISFGKEGEKFDPVKHECMSVVTTKKSEEDDTVIQIFQEGYRIGDELVRPAKVVVAQVEENS
jgi:molecular chaperone GrpE